MKKVTKLIWALRGYFYLELLKKGQKSKNSKNVCNVKVLYALQY